MITTVHKLASFAPRLLLSLILILWACDKPRGSDGAPQAQQTATPPSSARSDSALRELAPWLTLMAAGPDTTITIAAWLAANPASRVSEQAPDGMPDETFCRSAVDTTQSAGRTWARTAMFVIPQPPPGETLPDASAIPGRLCTLRGVWLTFVAPDELTATYAVSDLVDHFWSKLGNAEGRLALSGPGTGRWTSGSSWIAGPRVVVVAKPARNAAVAVSYLIGRDLAVDVGGLVAQGEYPKVNPEDVITLARADSVVSRAGLTGLEPLRRIYAHRLDSAHFDRSGRPVREPALDTVLEQALAALRDSAKWTAPQRAAAFFAADIAVRAHSEWLETTGEDSARAVRLTALGAAFAYEHHNAANLYGRSLLRRAYGADSLSPAGRSAFAELLRSGLLATCEPARLAERGEQALRAGNSDPLIHAIVAQAYADRYRGSGELAEPDTLRAHEAERRRAIVHYHHALGGIRDPGHRRQLWDDAAHLMIGRPIRNRYGCHPD